MNWKKNQFGGRKVVRASNSACLLVTKSGRLPALPDVGCAANALTNTVYNTRLHCTCKRHIVAQIFYTPDALPDAQPTVS